MGNFRQTTIAWKEDPVLEPGGKINTQLILIFVVTSRQIDLNPLGYGLQPIFVEPSPSRGGRFDSMASNGIHARCPAVCSVRAWDRVAMQ